MESCDSRPWKHSRVGFQLMEDSCYIGNLYSPERDSEWVIRVNGYSNAAFSNDAWFMRSKEKLSPSTYLYEFYNPRFKVKLEIPGVGWIGRHYVLTNCRKSRLYTNCTMLDLKIIKYRERLLQWYENEFEENSAEQQEIEEIEYPSESECLVLVIKAYNGKKALSEELKGIESGAIYTIQGPIVSNNSNSHREPV